MKKHELKSKGATSHSSAMKRLRLLSVAAVLLVCCLVFVGAVGAEDDWDGTVDTTWYNDVDTEFVLTTAEQLAGLAQLVDDGNTFAGKTIKLGDDINLYAIDEQSNRFCFEPIGDASNADFSGIFDGNGKTISNLYQDCNSKHLALFGAVYEGTVKNLSLENARVENDGRGYAGGIASYAGNSTFENIILKDSTIVNYNHNTGGIVAWLSNNGGTSYFENIYIDSTSTIGSWWGSYDTRVGGIVGAMNTGNFAVIKNSTIACKLDVYNDVTSNYQWWNYRTAGMVIADVRDTESVNGRTQANPIRVTCENVKVIFGEWANYHYCESSSYGTPSYAGEGEYKFKRVEAGLGYGGIDISACNHNADETHNRLIVFEELFGARDGKGIYGINAFDGVTVLYEVSFETKEGDPTVASTKVIGGNTVTKPVVTKEGYSVEWYSDAEFKTPYDFETPVTGPLTLYANWTANPYTVTFNPNGGSVTPESKTVTYGSPYGELPIPDEREGYSFKGWYNVPSVGGGTEFTAESIVMSPNDHTLYAQWVALEEEPTITPTTSGGGGEGNYLSYPRTTTNGGVTDFGSSKVVKAVLLPEGSSGSVVLNIDSIDYFPEELETEYTFDISVEKLGEGIAYIHFEIPESMLTALELTAADICAYHEVDGVWVKLPTAYEVKDGVVCYTAETDSFSPFKLVIEKGAAVPKAEETVPTIPPTEEPEDKPVDEPEEILPPIDPVEPTEPASPAPLAAVLVGLGAAVLLRRK